MADINIDQSGIITFDGNVVVDLKTNIPPSENEVFGAMYATLVWCKQLQDRVEKIEAFSD